MVKSEEIKNRQLWIEVHKGCEQKMSSCKDNSQLADFQCLSVDEVLGAMVFIFP